MKISFGIPEAIANNHRVKLIGAGLASRGNPKVCKFILKLLLKFAWVASEIMATRIGLVSKNKINQTQKVFCFNYATGKDFIKK